MTCLIPTPFRNSTLPAKKSRKKRLPIGSSRGRLRSIPRARRSRFCSTMWVRSAAWLLIRRMPLCRPSFRPRLRRATFSSSRRSRGWSGCSLALCCRLMQKKKGLQRGFYMSPTMASACVPMKHSTGSANRAIPFIRSLPATRATTMIPTRLHPRSLTAARLWNISKRKSSSSTRR
ncbi:hypothetical protein SDC9_160811 [bioreactor metagenome]|uniref:Uncharacterized protein n=1 Tax=bioreactor metagenome TaxID=1076179 RepID=A0A645FHQ4_9ZZZZ